MTVEKRQLAWQLSKLGLGEQNELAVKREWDLQLSSNHIPRLTGALGFDILVLWASLISYTGHS